MMLGREIKLPIDVWAGRPDDSGVPRNIPIYAQKLQEQMDEVHIFARDNLKISSGASKQYYDTKTMESWKRDTKMVRVFGFITLNGEKEGHQS